MSLPDTVAMMTGLYLSNDGDLLLRGLIMIVLLSSLLLLLLLLMLVAWIDAAVMVVLNNYFALLRVSMSLILDL